MLHSKQWFVLKVVNNEVVAALIRENQHNDTFGVQVGSVLFLNDSTDCGIREFAVIDVERQVQVDSWTIDWMTDSELRDSVAEVVDVEVSNLKPFTTFNNFSIDSVEYIS